MREATGPDRHKNARHWEIRAEQIRTIRNGAKNPGARACLARIAEDYDRLAEWAETHMRETGYFDALMTRTAADYGEFVDKHGDRS